MFISIVTTVGFNPVTEYEQLKQFELNNDLREWKKSESTVCVAYTKSEYNTVMAKESYDNK